MSDIMTREGLLKLAARLDQNHYEYATPAYALYVLLRHLAAVEEANSPPSEDNDLRLSVNRLAKDRDDAFALGFLAGRDAAASRVHEVKDRVLDLISDSILGLEPPKKT